MRRLIINADGYGFTAGITRAIEECVEFGTVLSLSANVNFSYADRLVRLVGKHPNLSVGCHINPVVGSPVLDPARVPSLLNERGEFFYREFGKRIADGKIDLGELRAEIMAQVRKTRDLAEGAFTHIDFHMGLHRLPAIYHIFLDAVEESGVRRMRTHRYEVGMESRFPKVRHYAYMLESPSRLPKYLWNLWLRRKAQSRGFAMPDRWVEITGMSRYEDRITTENYVKMLNNLPSGCSEFVAHPGYVDDDLRRWSTYLSHREKELKVLLSDGFRTALMCSDIRLVGYRDL